MKTIIFFDGVCNLCNSAVRFIIKRDRKGYFCFASLQSDFAKEYLTKRKVDLTGLESIILSENNKIFDKSTAVLKISSHLSGGWRLCRIFLIIPRFIRDFVYDIIAGNRYKWFGKKDNCMVPDESVKNRFLG